MRGTAAGMVTRLALLAAAPAAFAQGQPAAAPVLVNFVVKDGAVAASLTGKPGDAAKGRAVVTGRTLGNCIACHAVAKLSGEPFHGNIGPALDGVANRLSEGQMRLRLIDATQVNPDTIMPPFYRVDGLNKVMAPFQGKTILTAEQVEDALAFLLTLKD